MRENYICKLCSDQAGKVKRHLVTSNSGKDHAMFAVDEWALEIVATVESPAEREEISRQETLDEVEAVNNEIIIRDYSREDATVLIQEYIKKNPGSWTSDITDNLQMDLVLANSILNELYDDLSSPPNVPNERWQRDPSPDTRDGTSPSTGDSSCRNGKGDEKVCETCILYAREIRFCVHDDHEGKRSPGFTCNDWRDVPYGDIHDVNIMTCPTCGTVVSKTNIGYYYCHECKLHFYDPEKALLFPNQTGLMHYISAWNFDKSCNKGKNCHQCQIDDCVKRTKGMNAVTKVRKFFGRN